MLQAIRPIICHAHPVSLPAARNYRPKGVGREEDAVVPSSECCCSSAPRSPQGWSLQQRKTQGRCSREVVSSRPGRREAALRRLMSVITWDRTANHLHLALSSPTPKEESLRIRFSRTRNTQESRYSYTDGFPWYRVMCCTRPCNHDSSAEQSFKKRDEGRSPIVVGEWPIWCPPELSSNLDCHRTPLRPWPSRPKSVGMGPRQSRRSCKSARSLAPRCLVQVKRSDSPRWAHVDMPSIPVSFPLQLTRVVGLG